MQKRLQQLSKAILTGAGLWLIILVLAGSPHQSVQAALPPRPTPEPTPVMTLPKEEKGGYIKLQVEAAPAGMWTIVQWEDAQGEWHDVSGWQGTLDDGRTKLWWVAPEDFATGPFRWAAYTAPDGEQLGVSAKFTLPAAAREVILVDLNLDLAAQ